MPIELERVSFQKLIMENPNYFGTIAGSLLTPVKPMAANTTYEELTCIGFNPATNLLEAVIQIKRDVGYDGTLCQVGSQEYVRFFLDYGSGWVDDGVAAVKVHDISIQVEWSGSRSGAASAMSVWGQGGPARSIVRGLQVPRPGA